MRSAGVSLPVAGSPGAEAEFSLTSRRHDAIGPRGRWRLFASLCALSLGFALMFAARGAWPVLPYSVLEMGVLFWAFHRFERRIADWERITVCGDRVIVECERSGVRTRREFNASGCASSWRSGVSAVRRRWRCATRVNVRRSARHCRPASE